MDIGQQRDVARDFKTLDNMCVLVLTHHVDNNIALLFWRYGADMTKIQLGIGHSVATLWEGVQTVDDAIETVVCRAQFDVLRDRVGPGNTFVIQVMTRTKKYLNRLYLIPTPRLIDIAQALVRELENNSNPAETASHYYCNWTRSILAAPLSTNKQTPWREQS
ncbi:putative Clr5 domain-containing protein [Seiridium unicorne]|uniref:Clr5 domain-containing protein n=1 Tax=Seiridium unicorne TaxID=138068 RepID=A0ABR2UP02_9PEZI